MADGDPLFDRFIVVDWSASAAPKLGKDSIWVCSAGARDRRWDTTENIRTRVQARDRLRDLLRAAVDRDERVLVGCDFAFGYPVGSAAAFGLPGEPWRAIWTYLVDRIVDEPTNQNNRFAVASELNSRLADDLFWGRPAGLKIDRLSVKRDRARTREDGSNENPSTWRRADLAGIRAHSRPQSVWQLMGAGSVGSQTLVGIPMVAALRDDPYLAPISRVWPFELGVAKLPVGTAAIVYAEAWPSLPDPSVGPPRSVGEIRDKWQVERLAAWLRGRDVEGTLGPRLAVPATEEGWILGVDPGGPEAGGREFAVDM